MTNRFQIESIGSIKKQDETVAIKIYEEYKDGLQGLEQFSHILVCFWFHKNDNHEQRKTLRVYPRGNKANPLTGVFSTRTPVRPNLIGISVCEILLIDGTSIYIDKINAFNDSPVIDIKPYISDTDSISDAVSPEWLEKV